MRKVFTHLKFFLTVTALLMAVSSPLYADMEFTVDDIRYKSYDGTTAIVVSNPDVKYAGEIVIPKSVEYNAKAYSVTGIDFLAFSDCISLTSTKIPSSVTSIGKFAFLRCLGLTAIVVEDGNSVYDSREDCNAIIKKETNELITGCQTTKIPNSVTSIGSYAFSECTGLTSIKIPSSVTSIGEGAFSGCTGLTSIEIPSSVTSIGMSAFSGCTGLTSIEIPSSVTSIEESAFSGCTGLTSIEIPSSVTSIGYGAFSRCSGLTSIEIPSSVMSIGGSAFSGCTGLISIEIPNSVTSIGYGAFGGCSGLTSIVVEKENSVYDSKEACNAIIKTETGELIAGCQTTKIPNGVTSIKDYAFSYCTGLTSIKIPNSVTSIGDYAFHGCSGLSLIEIPNSVISIGMLAFNNCTSIVAIEIPSSVAVIGMWAFSYDTSLVSIKVDSNNPIYDSRNDCNAIIETKTNTLVVGCKTTYIPYSVTAIGGGAFCGLAGLTSIEIPCNVVSIGGKYDPSYGLYAIENCKDLASIICNSKKPPITEYDFWGIDKNIPVYVLCESLKEYKNAYGWKDFKNFRCIEADSTEDEIDEPMVEPDSKSVEIIWPVEEGADKYVITITLGGNPFCTLTFDSKGLLLNIDFAVAEPTTKSALATNAEITIYGYKFNITGLTKGTEYGYTVSALDVNDNVLKEFEGSFRTSDPVTVEDNQADSSHSISDSVLVNGKTISVSGIDDSDIRIYNTAGKQVGNPVPTAGVYVVAVGDEVVKVVVP